MKIQPQITYKDVPQTEAVDKAIQDRMGKLDKFHSRIMNCRVSVESPQQRQHQGKLFRVSINISIPGGDIVINKKQHEDLYVAIRDAFLAAERKLEESSRKQRGEVKTHDETPTGRVAKLLPDEGYGFILTSDGREIYFHRNSVIDMDFEKLKEGFEVAFLEEQGKKGPQAIRVTVTDAVAADMP